MNTPDLCRLSHETFEQYAALNAPDLPADPISALQVRLHRWQVANFGYQPAWMMVLGIAEEALDELQCAGSTDETVDAIGDALIYATQLCTDLRLDFGVLLREAKKRIPRRPVPTFGVHASAVGKISHAILKSSQGIRSFDDCDRLRSVIADALGILFWSLCTISSPWMDIEDAYRLTAEHVMARDWKADPVRGGVG